MDDGAFAPIPRARGELSDLEIRNLDIAFYTTRAERDSQSALDRARLAVLYLQRSRESGDPHDAIRAEEAARSSLALRRSHNSPTVVTLIGALLEQHRFTEARGLAESLHRSDPSDEHYRVLLAEIQLELGNYDAAGMLFQSIKSTRTSMIVGPRLARWEEIRGRDNVALSLLKAVRDSAVKRSDLPREQVAWFHLRIGEFDLRHGRPRRAERELRRALAIAPDDHRMLAAMAQLEASRGHRSRTIELGERSLAASLDPATLALLANAYRATGDSARAAEYDSVIDAALVSQPGPFHRSLSLYLLDQDRHVRLVLERAEQELRERHDVYGYDVYAWALFHLGRVAEAKVAMKQALRTGSQDPLLHRHAAAINRVSGQ